MLVTYVRPGISVESFHQPFHLVTYFRYFRFFDNGVVCALTSTASPKSVVQEIGVSCNIKDMIIADWVRKD
jgi:F-box only protein C-terminal region